MKQALPGTKQNYLILLSYIFVNAINWEEFWRGGNSEKVGGDRWRIISSGYNDALILANLQHEHFREEEAVQFISGPLVFIKVCNQYRYDKEKQAALESWERKLTGIVTGSQNNVVPMRRKAS
jgi:hypothetical protein